VQVCKFIYLSVRMDTDATINSDNKEQLQVEDYKDFMILQLKVEEIDDSSLLHVLETESVSGNWFADDRKVDLADLKHEPDDVCCVVCCIFSFL